MIFQIRPQRSTGAPHHCQAGRRRARHRDRRGAGVLRHARGMPELCATPQSGMPRIGVSTSTLRRGALSSTLRRGDGAVRRGRARPGEGRRQARLGEDAVQERRYRRVGAHQEHMELQVRARHRARGRLLIYTKENMELWT
jgi:hypothetical protein